MSFNQQFDQHGTWRREFAFKLKNLVEWLKEHDVLNAAVEERLKRLESQVRADKVMVAFVAEFSRGKSELINAMFFAGYGRRIMPASAGRTTMCPTELGYDPDIPPCLRLLPIETRLQPQTLMEWRSAADKWQQIALNVNDPAQLAQALNKVSEVRYVTQDEARALGFWHDTVPQDNPLTGPDGLIEVPRWRHALINIAHPLLKQGLVILDTPGLNAIGAEPELTVSLIPQAHAVVFILAADTGVTKSDLAIWREHLLTDHEHDNRLVVLNKIDTLWDALSTPEQVQAQIDRQRVTSAEILGLPLSQVIAISAQKGLVAKVTGDAALLQASQLPVLELALARDVIGQRQKILQAAVAAGIDELKREAARVLRIRGRDQTEQMLELQGLKGKNVSVIKLMRSRIEQEQVEFSSGGVKIHAVRSVHHTLLVNVVTLLSRPALKLELNDLIVALKQPGIKLRLKKTYGDTFSRLRDGLRRAQELMVEIQSMLDSSFRKINAEYGFSLQVPQIPDVSRYIQDLDLIERGHLQYLSLGNVMRLAQAEFVERLVRALSGRLRMVFETALAEVELWNKSASSQLDTQVRERRRNFERRLEAIERIQQAATGLDDRIDEMNDQENQLKQLEAKLEALTSSLMEIGLLPSAPQTLSATPGRVAVAEPT